MMEEYYTPTEEEQRLANQMAEEERAYHAENIERHKPPHSLTPFITGSYAYGQPTSQSDIDLVIPSLFTSIKQWLQEHSDTDISIRFGRLNIIACDTEEEWYVWQAGTHDLVQHKKKTGRPINKELAKFHLDVLRAEAQIEDNYERNK